MNMASGETYQPLNAKLLAKRKETEKLIINEHLKVKSLLVEKQKLHKKLTSVVEILQEESNALINRSSILTVEITQLKHSIMHVQNSVQEILYTIDGITPKKMVANKVQEKEKRILQLFYDKMEHQKRIFTEFWRSGLENSGINELENKKIKLLERKDVLQSQIDWFKEKCSELTTMKLTEECMILRKRNAAFLKRKTRILEQLEKTVLKKREEIARAKRNMIFKSS